MEAARASDFEGCGIRELLEPLKLTKQATICPMLCETYQVLVSSRAEETAHVSCNQHLYDLFTRKYERNVAKLPVGTRFPSSGLWECMICSYPCDSEKKRWLINRSSCRVLESIESPTLKSQSLNRSPNPWTRKPEP